MANRRIKKTVQLVIQSNDCRLFSVQPISELFVKSKGIAGDVSPKPNRTIYLEKNGDGKYFADTSRYLKQKFKYVQKINIDYVLKNGFSYKESYDFPVRLYENFIKIESRKELEEFVEKNNFCIFPSEAELRGLKAEYQNMLLADDVEHVIANFPLEENLQKRVQENQRLLRKINLDFLWEKKRILKMLVERFNSKKMIYHDFLWLNDQMENTSDMLLDPQHFSLKQINPTYEQKNDHPSGDYYRERKLWQTMLVPGHRVFGHFALCCFEFFLDINEAIAMVICPYCGRVIGPKSGKKWRCGSEKPECVTIQQNEDRRKQRINEEKNESVDNFLEQKKSKIS
jgi:hypothetical protein